MKYKEISEEDYFKLQDQTGAYLVLWPDGDKFWYLNGLSHREDGPAIELANGYKAWWFNGERHREDGPAIERPDGTKEWWLYGKYYETEEEWKIALDELRIKEIKDQII